MKKSMAMKITLGLVLGGLLASGSASAATGTELSLSNTGRANYFMNTVEEDSLHTRLGELREGEEKNGVWVKSFYSKGEGDSHGYWGINNAVSGFDQSVHGFQVGYDRKVSSNDKRNIYVGGFIGTTRSNVDYDYVWATTTDRDSVEEDMTGYSGGIYGVYHKPSNDFYVNGTVKFGTVKNEIDIHDGESIYASDSDRRSNWGASAEVGQKFFMGKAKTDKQGFYLEPSAQLAVGKIGSTTYFENEVQVDDVNYFNSKLGLRAGYDVKKGSTPVNVYGKIAWHHAFNGEASTMFLEDKDLTVDHSDKNWFSYGIGVSAQFKKQHSVHLDLEMTSGADVDKKFGISGGYRFTF